LFAFAVIAATVFVGCKKDDDNTSALVGKWEATFEYKYEEGEWVKDYTYDPGETMIEFKNDGTYIFYDDSEDPEEGNYTYNEGSKKITTSLKGTPSASATATVIELTGSRFVIEYEDEDEYRTEYKRL
jgi:hypothetical protein